MEKGLYVPQARAIRSYSKIEVNKPNKYGYQLKLAIRNLAKKHPNYHLKIYNEFLPTTVTNPSTWNDINVDTLGKWMFGVPGYKGHLIFDGSIEDKIIIYYPEKTPKEAIDLLNDIINKL